MGEQGDESTKIRLDFRPPETDFLSNRLCVFMNRGLSMSKLLKTLLGVAAGALIAGNASAADLAAPEPMVEAAVPSLFDVAFGVAGVTDYRFRGITQSKKDPAVQGYVELQTDWIYAGVWASSVNFPTRFGLTDPSAEIDFYAGFRHTFFDVLTVDLGGLYYYYPGEFAPGPVRQTDYWELFAKPALLAGDWGSVTGNIYWTSDFLNTGSNALYLSIIPKLNIPLTAIPDAAFYVSGEIGKQWIDKTTVFGAANFNPNDYVTWNIGAGMTYKAMTLDVRYSDTDLSKAQCLFNTLNRNWCGDTVVGKIAFDTSFNKLK